MRKQSSSAHDEEASSQSEQKHIIRQPAHSAIIPPSNLNFVHGAFSVQNGIDSESVTYSHHDLKPHLTELRPVAESHLGQIPNIFIPTTQQNGYEMMSNNSSFLTPSPQHNTVFTIGMPVSTSEKSGDNSAEDSIINIKTETPPDTPASETTHMSFTSKSDSEKIDSMDPIDINNNNNKIISANEVKSKVGSKFRPRNQHNAKC